MIHGERINELLHLIEKADRQLDTVEKVDCAIKCCKDLYEYQATCKHFGSDPENPILVDTVSANTKRANGQMYVVWRIARCLKRAKTNDIIVPLPTWVRKHIDMRVNYYLKSELPQTILRDDIPTMLTIRSAGKCLSRLLDLEAYFDICVPRIDEIRELRATIGQYWVFGGQLGISESDRC